MCYYYIFNYYLLLITCLSMFYEQNKLYLHTIKYKVFSYCVSQGGGDFPGHVNIEAIMINPLNS